MMWHSDTPAHVVSPVLAPDLYSQMVRSAGLLGGARTVLCFICMIQLGVMERKLEHVAVMDSSSGSA